MLPDVPTVARGRRARLRGRDLARHHGAGGHAASAIVERLNAEITKIANAPEMKEAWAKQGAAAMTMSPEEFAPLHARGHRQVGAHREDLRRQAGPVGSTRRFSAPAPPRARAHAWRAAAGIEVAGTLRRGRRDARDASSRASACDVVILTHAQVDELAAQARVAAATVADLGRCATAIAVRAGEPLPDVSTARALRAALARRRTRSTSPTRRRPPPASTSQQGAGAARHPSACARACRRSPTARTAMRAMAESKRRPRLHAGHRDPRDARREAGRRPCRRASTSRPSTPRR